MVERGRLQVGASAPISGERMEPIARLANTTIEQILSSASPDPVVYQQPQDEWVLLLEGAATLDVEGETVTLEAGDWLLLPAHTQHRVIRTQAGTSWLAIHGASAGNSPTAGGHAQR